MSGWRVTFEGFDPDAEGLREALCTLGNGYFATRGAAAEASADPIHYPGTYLAGGYNRLVTRIAGREVENEDLVNLPNWLALRVRAVNGPWLDVHGPIVRECRQSLDVRDGVLLRELTLEDDLGRITRIESRRLVSMSDPHVGATETVIVSENWDGEAEIECGIDHGVSNAGVARYRALNAHHLEPLSAGRHDAAGVFAHVRTSQSRLEVVEAASTRLHCAGSVLDRPAQTVERAGFIGLRFSVRLRTGEPLTVDTRMALHSSRDRASAGCREEACDDAVHAMSFAEVLREHAAAWGRLWRHADVRMQGPSEEHQRVLRLHLFHLLQTVSPHSVELDCGVPARGWHGEAYRGHVFWDELFILPFFSLRFPDMARAILRYRHRRLGEARRAARRAGLDGALFPWQSASNGREETQRLHLNPRSGRWLPDHSHLQRHVNLAIAYNVWQYYQITADLQFLRYEGGELIVEIARAMAGLATFDRTRDRYVIEGVVGPDEFHDAYPDSDAPGIDNNAYTNIMTVWVLQAALELLEVLPRDARRSLVERLAIGDEEVARWDAVSRRMFVPFLENGLLAQFEGYGDLAEFDWAAYAQKYGNIQRLDRILEAEGDSANRYRLSKQADVLMLFYLLTSQDLAAILSRLGYDFDPGRIPETVRYYLARTSHGSTLSEVVHAWVLARSDRATAWSLFEQALYSDFRDSQGGTTREGVHLGAMAATVDMVQRAYTGCAFRGGCLHLEPCLPGELQGLSLEIRYRGNRLTIEVARDTLTVTAACWSREALPYRVRDEAFCIGPGERRQHRIVPPAPA